MIIPNVSVPYISLYSSICSNHLYDNAPFAPTDDHKKFIRHLENTNIIHVSVCPVPNQVEFSLSITKLECLTFPTLSDLSVHGRA